MEQDLDMQDLYKSFKKCLQYTSAARLFKFLMDEFKLELTVREVKE